MTAPSRDPSELPTGLRERVLAASVRARQAGRPVPDAPEIPAGEAFSRSADAFYTVLRGLDDGDWTRPALRGLDVQGLVGHLIGVENDVHRCLSGDPDVASVSHVESTQAAAIGQAGLPPARTRADWRRAADRTLDLVRSADPAAEVAVHGMRYRRRARSGPGERPPVRARPPGPRRPAAAGPPDRPSSAASRHRGLGCPFHGQQAPSTVSSTLGRQAPSSPGRIVTAAVGGTSPHQRMDHQARPSEDAAAGLLPRSRLIARSGAAPQPPEITIAGAIPTPDAY